MFIPSVILTLIGLVLLGWLIGVFLNFLADILPVEHHQWQAVCQHCLTPFSWKDYLFLKSCRNCAQARSRRAWIVQIASILGTLLLWFMPPDRFGFWWILPYMVYIALVAIIDIEHRLILHVVSLVGAFLALPLGIPWNGWLSTLIGGLAGAAIMFVLFFLGELFRRAVSRARNNANIEEALGFGDVTLMAVLGLMLGWPKISFDLVFAIMLAGLVSGLYMLWMALRRNYHPFSAIPYGPFLLIGAVILIYLA